MSKAVKNLSQPAPQAPQKPAVKKTPKPKTGRDPWAKYGRLTEQELEARFLEVGITALGRVRTVSHALDGLMGILTRGDEADAATADLMKLPLETLREAVGEFRGLDDRYKKVNQLLDEEKKEAERVRGNAKRPQPTKQLVTAEHRQFLAAGR